MIKNTYWLASYPKSGNTWFRMFLNQLLGSEQTLNINDLPIKNTIASARNGFDASLGINSSDLLQQEIDYLRPFSDELYSNAVESTTFRKIHDAYISPYTHNPIISTKISAGAIYIVRNPLDVLVSYHYHLNKSIEATLKILNGLNENRNRRGIKSQFDQYMGGWSHHVNSWTKQNDMPVHIVRYEDLLTDPFTHFKTAMKFLQIERDDTLLKLAIENTRFDKLKQQESKVRFVETPNQSQQFFRKGVAGAWNGYLTSSQVEQIISTHSVVMKELGYLDKYLKPVF